MLEPGRQNRGAETFPSVDFLRRLVGLKREAAAADQALLTSLVDGAIVETVRLIEQRQRGAGAPSRPVRPDDSR